MKRNKFINLCEYWAFRTFLWKLRILPYCFSKWILCRLFACGYHLGIRRKIADANIQKVYPEMDLPERSKLLRSIYKNLALTIAETYVLKEELLVQSCSINGKSHAEEALSYGRGAIMATAHFSNWEAARVFPRLSFPLSVLVKKQHNPYFDMFNNTLRTKHGVKLINFRRGLRDILVQLKQNTLVGILVDQNAGPAGLQMEFMGHTASHWKGVAKLSLRYKIPIVPCFALRTEQGRIQFCMEPIIYHPELEDIEENYMFILRKIDDVLEKYINKHPEQWLWLHNRWKKTKIEPSSES